MKYAIVLVLVIMMGCPGEYDAADLQRQYIDELNEMFVGKGHYGYRIKYYRRLAAESYAMEFGRLLAIRDYQQKYGDLP